MLISALWPWGISLTTPLRPSSFQIRPTHYSPAHLDLRQAPTLLNLFSLHLHSSTDLHYGVRLVPPNRRRSTRQVRNCPQDIQLPRNRSNNARRVCCCRRLPHVQVSDLEMERRVE